MTDATYSGPIQALDATRERTRDLPLPRPVPFGAPVFIYDCMTPVAGDTLLGLLMRRMANLPDGSDQSS